MKKFITISVVALLAIGLVASSAMAVNETSNTAQATKRGSLLIFPKVDTRGDFDPLSAADDTYRRDTIISIGNDLSQDVTLECIWKYPVLALTEFNDTSRIDQLTGEVPAVYRAYTQTCCDEENFTIKLTAKQVIYFSAGTGIANVLGADLFDTTNQIPAASNGVAALTCFAIKGDGNKTPIAFNGLYGEAQIVRFDNYEDNGISSWEYNAWAFKGRADTGVALGTKEADGSRTLPLKGVKNTYDACPNYLTFNFIARQAFNIVDDLPDYDTTAIPIIGTDITLYPCTQDLREFDTTADPKKETRTLAVFSIWNANEDQFSGTQACVKCWFEQILGVNYTGRSYRQPAPGGFANDAADPNFGYKLPDIMDAFQFIKGDNFIFMPVQGGLGTLFGRARVQALAATAAGTLCAADTIKTPLLGVAFDFWDIATGIDNPLIPDGTPEATAGRSMTGVGLEEATIRFSPNS